MVSECVSGPRSAARFRAPAYTYCVLTKLALWPMNRLTDFSSLFLVLRDVLRAQRGDAQTGEPDVITLQWSPEETVAVAFEVGM